MKSQVITYAAFCLILLVLCSFFGCASTGMTQTSVTLEETQGIFDAAKFTGAAVKSPYEFFSAELYLKKAGDELNLGNTRKANIYLNMAYEQAQKAYENAKRYQRSK